LADRDYRDSLEFLDIEQVMISGHNGVSLAIYR
jgi:hypothetical protein